MTKWWRWDYGSCFLPALPVIIDLSWVMQKSFLWRFNVFKFYPCYVKSRYVINVSNITLSFWLSIGWADGLIISVGGLATLYTGRRLLWWVSEHKDLTIQKLGRARDEVLTVKQWSSDCLENRVEISCADGGLTAGVECGRWMENGPHLVARKQMVLPTTQNQKIYIFI